MEHALFSPSAMHRKLACPASHLATLGMSSPGGPEAEYGTQCHTWAEELFGNTKSQPPEFTQDWQEKCTRDMVKMAWDIQEEYQLQGQVEVYREERISLEWLSDKDVDMNQVWGTADLIMYCKAARTLIVLDYKTGIGVPVDPDSAQLRIYGLGALGKVGYPNVSTVELVIAQPRLDPMPKRFKITSAALLTWGEETLKPAIKQMQLPGAPFKPGEHCRWCPIEGKCKARAKMYIDIFDEHPQPKQEAADGILDARGINDLLKRVKSFRKWCSDIESTAIDMMKAGQVLPDFKLVHGRSNRRWADEEAAEKFLMGQKLKMAERYNMKLISPTQAEKVIAEKLKNTRTQKRFAELVEKPPGKITWAPANDKREAVNVNPVANFKTIDDLI